MDEKSNLYIVAIVGVVAVVAMIVLVLGAVTPVAKYISVSTGASAEDATGQVAMPVMIGGIIYNLGYTCHNGGQRNAAQSCIANGVGHGWTWFECVDGNGCSPTLT